VDSYRETSWTNSAGQGLVDALGVEGQVADEVSFGGQDPDVMVSHQDQDGLSAMPASKVTLPVWTRSWRTRQCGGILKGWPEGRAFLRALKATWGVLRRRRARCGRMVL
jgi:hypothetical protein